MTNLKPTLWKVLVSLVVGILIYLGNPFREGERYSWSYAKTIAENYNYSFFELITRGILTEMILGFIFGVITIYLIYSLFQKEKKKWKVALVLFILFIIAFIIYIFIGFGDLFGYGAPVWQLYGIYGLFVLIYMGLKTMGSDLKLEKSKRR